MEFEDGEETKSDFLARMILMGRIDIDEDNKTLKSKTTCKEENPECVLPEKPSKLVNPIVACTSACDDKQNCSMFNVTAKGFFSSYTQKIEQEVLDGAKALINEASKSDSVVLNPDGDSVKNEANTLMDEWHHKYNVSFSVAASTDPKSFLTNFFEKNVKQLGEAAVRIAYVETVPVEK